MKNYKIIFIFILNFFGAAVKANSLIRGEAITVGPVNMEGVLANPATAVNYKEHAFSIGITPNQRSQQTRYPGSPLSESEKFEAFTIPAGGFVYRVNPRFSIGMGIPIPGLTANIKETGIPIPILGQAPLVDLNATGTLLKFDGFAAYSVTPKISIGIGAGFSSTDAEVSITDTNSDSDSALKLKISSSSFYGKVGTHIKINPRLHISAAATVVESKSQKIDLGINLNSNDSTENNDDNNLNFLPKAVIGVGFRINPRFDIFGEVVYEAPPAGKRISLADLKEEEIDGTPAIGFHMGTKYGISRSLSVLGGGSYVPTTIGPGKRGQDPTGYGLFEFNLASLAGERIKPYWLAGGGLEYNFAFKNKSRIIRKDNRVRRVERSMSRAKLSAGIAYEQTSVGIDSDGEIPAAFDNTRIYVPISFEWKFW